MNNSEETKLSYKDVLKLYNIEGDVARKIALKNYTCADLEISPNNIGEKLSMDRISLNIPHLKRLKYDTLATLEVLAEFFNDGWEKNNSNTGYYIGYIKSSSNINYRICTGANIQSVGTVYFKEERYLQRAIEIIGEDKINSLFN